MRTTVDIDDDILGIVRSVASRQKSTMGEVLSQMVRKGLSSGVGKAKFKNGLRVISRDSNAKPVTLDLVNQLRDESP